MTTYAPILISILSLVVSIVSASVAYYAAWRAAQAEKPVFWIDVARTEKSEMYLTTVSVRNRSKFDMRMESVSVPIQAVPVTKKQDFVLVQYSNALQISDDGTVIGFRDIDKVERCLKFSFDKPKTVHPETTETQKFWLIRSPISAADQVELSFGVRIMKQKPQYKRITLTAKITSSGMVLQVPMA
jgi:hypothetical protein